MTDNEQPKTNQEISDGFKEKMKDLRDRNQIAQQNMERINEEVNQLLRPNGDRPQEKP